MKRTVAMMLAAVALLLTGCANTISSNVLTYSQWPAEMADKSFVFTMPKNDTIEYRIAENQVREQLRRLGMRDVADGGQAALAVTLDLRTTARDVRVVTPVVYDPFWAGRYGWHSPYYYRGLRRGLYPFRLHSPLMYQGMVSYEESVSTHFFRQMRVAIHRRADNVKLWESMVENTSRSSEPMRVLPAMAISAFEGFPAQSGVPRRVEIKTGN